MLLKIRSRISMTFVQSAGNKWKRPRSFLAGIFFTCDFLSFSLFSLIALSLCLYFLKSADSIHTLFLSSLIALSLRLRYCLRAWISQQKSCPTCRSPLSGNPRVLSRGLREEEPPRESRISHTQRPHPENRPAPSQNWSQAQAQQDPGPHSHAMDSQDEVFFLSQFLLVHFHAHVQFFRSVFLFLSFLCFPFLFLEPTSCFRFWMSMIHVLQDFIKMLRQLK